MVEPVAPSSLIPGDVVEYAGVPCEVQDPPQPQNDLFGRRMLKVLAVRKDTGRIGYLFYGPGGTADLLERPLAV